MSKQPFQNFVVSFPAGGTIFREAEEGATMYIVQSGKVQLFRELEGEQRLLGTMEKGDFFGEMSILEGLPRTANAVALEAAELIEINTSTFDKMIRGNIEIAVRMLRKLSIRLREVERRLVEVNPAGARASAMSASAKGPAPTTVRQAVDGARLVVEQAEGGVFALAKGEAMIGRYDPVTEQRPDIDLSDLDLKRSVSRRHARILYAGEGYSIVEEVGALNGTFVNGDKVTTGQPRRLADGDRLSVGTVSLLFRV